MSLQLSLETNSIYEKHKPEVDASGLQVGLGRTEDLSDVSIIPTRPNFDKGRLVTQGFKSFPHSFFQSHVWRGAKLKYRAFIVEVLARCVWKKMPYMVNGHTVELLPGEFACSLRGILDLFNPQGLKGRATEDSFSKNDIEGAIQYFSYHQIIRQEIRHQTTILKFVDPEIYDLNFSFNQTDNQTEIRQKSDSHLKEPDNQITKDIVPKGTLARTVSRPRNSDILKFSFESGSYEGITDKDRSDWKVAYPAINLDQQIAASIQWLKSNPTKAKSKIQWRKFLTGWLTRSNDRAVNQLAYAQTSSKPSIDRRQVQEDGSPVNKKKDW